MSSGKTPGSRQILFGITARSPSDFGDSGFEKKKPDLRGDWKARCGDNFYARRSDGVWIQHRNRFHLDEASRRRDTRYARVFIGSRFWYLGRAARALRAVFASLSRGRGARIEHDPGLVAQFKQWVVQHFEPGVAALPNDDPDIPAALLEACG